MTSETLKRPVRVLASRETANKLKNELNSHRFLGLTKIQLVIGEDLNPKNDVDVDFDFAFISRDITSTSTKYQVIPYTQHFYDLLKSASQLKWVHIHSAGIDRPIYQSLLARGVEITNSSGANAKIVAHSALAGILALNRHFPRLWKAQRQHQWLPLQSSSFKTHDLENQNALIVGHGPIGINIAKLLQAFGLNCEFIRFNSNQFTSNSCFHISEILDRLPSAQWLILACPLSDITRDLINKRLLRLLPSNASVINVARGEIIVEQDLVEAIQKKEINGAYLDVFEQEPLPSNSPLWDLENVIITPHSAGHSVGNESRVKNIFLDNLIAHLKKFNG